MRAGLGREVAAAYESKDFPRLVRALNSRAVVDETDGRGCLIWQGGLTSSGYGYLQAPDGTNMLVHRYIGYGFAGFLVPRDDEHVGHACEKKPCILPQHLSIVTARQNMQEGGARHYLDKVIAQLSLTEPPDQPSSPDPLVGQAVHDIDELRHQGILQRAAVKQIGRIPRTTYERSPNDAPGRGLLRGGIEYCIQAQDRAGILAYVLERVTRDPTDPNSCWMWKRKTTTDGYPSVGTLSTHHRVPRVIMWSVHGFHGKLTDLPNVWHHCKKKLCVNPDHLRLITEYLALVDPMLRDPRLAQIEKLDGAMESFALGSPRHVV